MRRRQALRLLGVLPAAAGTGIGAGTGDALAAQPAVLVLRADAAGHFNARGDVDGRPVDFLIDTGATAVTLGQRQAEALGLPWRDAPRAWAETAQGDIEARLLELAEVRLGPLRARRVGAAVIAAPLPRVLLGNSFLGRYRWLRDGALLTLSERP